MEDQPISIQLHIFESLSFFFALINFIRDKKNDMKE